MADQREAVEIAMQVLACGPDRDRHECGDCAEMSGPLARAVLALDEEVRRLRGEAGNAACLLEAKSDRAARKEWAAALRQRIGGEQVGWVHQPAPSSPGASEPSEADVDAIATRLMLTWAAHVEARDADEPDGSGVTLAGLSFDEAIAMAREAIRLGARVPSGEDGHEQNGPPHNECIATCEACRRLRIADNASTQVAAKPKPLTCPRCGAEMRGSSCGCGVRLRHG